MKYGLKIGNRALYAITMAAIFACLGMSVLAVETGTGTNQIANVYATNSINLRGIIITNWTDVSGTAIDQTARDAAAAAQANVGTASNALNTAIGTETTARIGTGTALSNSVSALNNATGALNTAVGNLQGATNALNTRVGATEGDVSTLEGEMSTATTDISDLQGATNALNTRAGNLQNATNALNTAIGTEATTRGNADTALQNNIGYASNALNTAIGTETTARIGTGTALSNSVNTLNNGIYGVGTQTIPAYGTVTVAYAVAKIGTEDAALKTLGNPQVAPGTAGQFITLQCTNTGVKVVNGSGVALEEGVSFTMSANDILQLVYDGSQWVEVHRADN